MLNVAMLSRWHVHAKGYAATIRDLPNARVTVVWDEDARRGAEWAADLGVPFEAELNAVLARPDVDAVIVDAPTDRHPEVMIAAARAKKHIFTEKVMCLTVAECRTVAEEIRKNGVRFGISFPQRTLPANLMIKKFVDDGVLGDITMFRMRDAHDGASGKWLPDYWYDPKVTGGGAMMDLGAHPMYLSWWIMGRPKTIQSTFTYKMGTPIEDNALCTLSYASGAVAVVETSLVSGLSARSLEIYGTEGCALVRNDVLTVRSRKLNMPMDGWLTPVLPKGLPSPLVQFVEGVVEGKPVAYGIEEAIGLTELMENAYIAHRKGVAVEFA